MKFLILHLLILINVPLFSQATWTGGGDGTSWDDANNWSILDIPNSDDNVVFNPIGVTVTLNSDVTISSLTMGSSTINLNGNSFTISNTFDYSYGILEGNSGSITFNGTVDSDPIGLKGTFSNINLNANTIVRNRFRTTVVNLNINQGTFRRYNTLNITNLNVQTGASYLSNLGSAISGNIFCDGTCSITGLVILNGSTNLSGAGTIEFGQLRIGVADLLVNRSEGFSILTNFENRGTFTPNNGSVNFSGTNTSIINYNDIEFYDLIVESNLTNNENITITHELRPISGSITNNGTLTLQSTALSGDARISELGLGFSFSGNIKAQRFIDGTIGGEWREMCSPLVGITLNTWKSAVGVTGNFSDRSLNYNFSLINNLYSLNPSVYRFTDGETGWTPINGGGGVTSSFSIDNAVGYSFFNYNESNTVFEMEGTYPNSPSISVGPGTTSDFTLIGNPYPSPIDWDNVYSAHSSLLGGTVYVRTANGVYATYNANGGATSGHPSPTWGGEILMGQSFWVEALSTGTVNFTESMKSTEGEGEFLRLAPKIIKKVDISLINEKNGQDDMAVVVLNSKASKSFDPEFDGRKLFNGFPDELPGLRSHINIFTANFNDLNTKYAINTIDSFEEPISLGIDDVKQGSYKLVLSSENIETDISLLDNYLGVVEEIRGEFTYNFEVDSDERSYNINRFQILFGKYSPKENIDLRNLVNLWPNPANDVIHLNLDHSLVGKGLNVRVTDISGKVTLEQNNLSNEKISFNIGNLPRGIYIISLYNEQSKYNFRLIKQ